MLKHVITFFCNLLLFCQALWDLLPWKWSGNIQMRVIYGRSIKTPRYSGSGRPHLTLLWIHDACEGHNSRDFADVTTKFIRGDCDSTVEIRERRGHVSRLISKWHFNSLWPCFTSTTIRPELRRCAGKHMHTHKNKTYTASLWAYGPRC